MSDDPTKSLVDPDSKIDSKNYIESPQDAYSSALHANNPAGVGVGVVTGTGSEFFTEGVGQHHDDYTNQVTGQSVKGTGWLSGVPVADDDYAFYKALEENKKQISDLVHHGKLDDPGALFDLILAAAGVAADTVGAFADPAGALVQTGTAWLLNHFRPLRMMIDGLTGIPEVITGYANSWSNVEQFLQQVSSDFQNSYQSGPGPWEGAAHDRYLSRAATVGAALDASATVAKSMAAMIKTVGDVVSAVRSWIIQTISALVGEIPDIAEALVGDEGQAGAGTLAKGAKVVEESGQLIKALQDALGTISTVGGLIVFFGSTINSVVRDFSSAD